MESTLAEAQENLHLLRLRERGLDEEAAALNKELDAYNLHTKTDEKKILLNTAKKAQNDLELAAKEKRKQVCYSIILFVSFSKLIQSNVLLSKSLC